MYKDNRLGRSEDRDPDLLARYFVATLRGEKFPDYVCSGRPSVEIEYRSWLTSPEAVASSWDESDWPQLRDALVALMQSDADTERTVLVAIGAR